MLHPGQTTAAVPPMLHYCTTELEIVPVVLSLYVYKLYRFDDVWVSSSWGSQCENCWAEDQKIPVHSPLDRYLSLCVHVRQFISQFSSNAGNQGMKVSFCWQGLQE